MFPILLCIIIYIIYIIIYFIYYLYYICICMQQRLYEHFYREGHNGLLGNVSISSIDKTDGVEPKKRENYWMRTLKPLVLLGIYVEIGL